MKDKEFSVKGCPFKMIFVEGGTFEMGYKPGRDGEDDIWFSDAKHLHNVTLSDFWLAEIPLTQALYQAITGENPSRFKGSFLPVETVSWEEAQEFIGKLNEFIKPLRPSGTSPLEGEDFIKDSRLAGANTNPLLSEEMDSKTQTPLLQKEGSGVVEAGVLEDFTFRLPTEAEWEYAARGGIHHENLMYAGRNNVHQAAWYNENSGKKIKPPGLKQANKLGLHDMSGNVWEWCQDWYAKDYYKNSPEKDPPGPASGSYRLGRGGSWRSGPQFCRSANRSYFSPGSRGDELGFRLAGTLDF